MSPLTFLAVGNEQTQLPVTSFGNEPIWLTIGKALFVFVLLVLLTLFSIVFERKIVSYMQQRIGPNRVGPRGYLQSLADGLKLALKEEIIPALADKPVYILAPILSAVPAFLAFSVIPFGPKVSVAGHQTALQLTDLPVGVLFVFACSSLGVFGIVLAGWSSGSTYPLLGGLRSAAQVISYEIAMGLSLVAVFLYAGSLSTSEIVAAQSSRWFIVTLPVSFVIYVIAMVGETNRAPFDLPEAESELVGGFHTEYTSLKFAMFFLAEYINMITVSALAVTLFLGGWRPPPFFARVDMFSEGWFPLIWFLLKVVAFIFVFVWLRGTLPRMRYDQFMKFGWKGLVPISLVWILLVAAIRTATLEVENRRSLLLAVGAVFLVVLAIFYLLPQPEPDQQSQEGSGLDLVPLEQGGFPTPPLDLVVPPTPRSLVGAGAISAGSQPAYGTIPPDKPASEPAPETPNEADRG
jgi:NADH-quinone oxidoreductase subunit H